MLINAILILFLMLMIWAAISDIRFYILSNKLCLAVTALYFIYLISLYLNSSPYSIEYIMYSLGISLIIFAALFALFAFGLLGGGDVKLIPAVSLWAGPSLTLDFLLITACCGGALSLIYLGFFYIKQQKTSKSSDKINLSVSESEISNDEGNRIPYGVAIAAGGFYIIFQLFRSLN